MAKKQTKDKVQSVSNVIREYNVARLGMDMDSSEAQIVKGKLSYALNAVVENFDSNSINYQNEPGNIHCLEFPPDYILIGRYFINEQYKHIFFLTNPLTGNSQIGYMVNNDCKYVVLISDPCLGFSVNFPIHKVEHRITNCTTEIYWADNVARRYLDIDNLPYKLLSGTAICDPVYSDKIDCNQLKVQPNFSIPAVNIKDVTTGGNLTSGTVQFTAQYSDASGNPLTAYYSVTNPCPINDPFTVTVNYNTPVGKSVVVQVGNLDLSGQYGYFNLAVITTVNNIPAPSLVGTYSISGITKDITYTGQNEEAIQLSMNDILEEFPYYEQADDLTAVRDVLVWKGLTTIDRINYQSIASKITLNWETHRIPADESYADELNATNKRGYLRDEIYPFEIVFLLTNGRQTDGFHIPGREALISELLEITTDNPDFVGTPERTVGSTGYSPYWKIYNTGSLTGDSPGKTNDVTYNGAYQYGEFAYWESSDEYPCNEDLWGDLAGKPIRHHKFPDVLVSPINEASAFTTSEGMVMEDTPVYPIGVRVSLAQINTLIQSSSLTEDQKNEIAGIKIIRGNRGTNKSIIGKGILRNVGKYEREGEEYYFPNYPYNDISTDPFLNKINNAWTELCDSYIVDITDLGVGETSASVRIKDCNTNKSDTIEGLVLGEQSICSIGFPIINGPAEGTVKVPNFDTWVATSDEEGFWVFVSGYDVEYLNAEGIITTASIAGTWGSPRCRRLEVFPGTTPVKLTDPNGSYLFGPGEVNDQNDGDCGQPVDGGENIKCIEDIELDSIEESDTGRHQIFNSPETSFGQPFLGSTLKLENVLFGRGKAHFVSVKDNAKYRLLTEEAQEDAIKSAASIADETDPWNPLAFFAAYEAYIEIYVNSIARSNFAYSYNSIASYNYSADIANDIGKKQRKLETFRYLIPGVQSVEQDTIINNYNRETSVFLKTDPDTIEIPFPKDSPNMAVLGVEDRSRITIGGTEEGGTEKCATPGEEQNIEVVSYYASLKNIVDNQWGQIYSYTTVDTGFQKTTNATNDFYTVFGGDTFISKFAFKTKLPFFIDNRVNAPDDSDIFYDEIGNIAYPVYWHSARSITTDPEVPGFGIMPNYISYKAHNFDCPNSQALPIDPDTEEEILLASKNPDRLSYDGKYYLFAYGVPSFYCESSYNLDLRQAFNNKEGEFWPHVSSSIPDDWVQETNVTILYDNTYTYNVTYSKQNKENSFTNLPPDWSDKMCYTHYPFRAIYSDVQFNDENNKANNWLIYRAVSYYDFPQNYGKFISIDGIHDSQILTRFENKTLLYNSLITMDTSNPQAVYIGNSKLFSSAPPVDFADTDLGFLGTQNKMLLKIPNGQVTVDAKRGHVFLLQGRSMDVISKYGSGMNSFLKEHLPYKMLKHFPETKEMVDGEIITTPGINVDNNFIGVGLHGVYDNRFERVILTKLDYLPLSDDIVFDPYAQKFSVNGTEIELTDPTYFCNKSWTLSYNLNTKSWISFHSYIPNFYIAENNFFYSGQNECCSPFDFIAGELVATPSTTTTTTLYRAICTPFIGTAVEQFIAECTPLTGTLDLTDCVLVGSGVITVPPACERPEGVVSENLVIEYNSIDTTASSSTACIGMDEIQFNGATPTFLSAQTLDTAIGNTVYLSNGTNDCEIVQDGWYFTMQTLTSSITFHVVNGVITEVYACNPTTTTTTTMEVGPISISDRDADCSSPTPYNVWYSGPGGGYPTQGDIIYLDAQGNTRLNGADTVHKIEYAAGLFNLARVSTLGVVGLITEVCVPPTTTTTTTI
jgi:hypothetical protein